MTEESPEWFERLSALRDNPEEFERVRKELIEEAISEFPEENQDRAHRFQWTIDQERRKYKDPVACYNRLLEMYTVSLIKWDKAFKGQLEIPQATDSATILEFKRQSA